LVEQGAFHHAMRDQIICVEAGGSYAGIPFSPAVSFAQPAPVNVTTDTSKTGAPISKYIYRQFLGHGGNIGNESVWAEMLEENSTIASIQRLPSNQPVQRRIVGR
jgi:hypothetical protein